MLISTDILEQVLQENGINWVTTKDIINRSKKMMSESSVDQQIYLDKLYLKAIELMIKPSDNGTISEQQAIKLLGKSPAFFKVARNQGRLTPNYMIVGNGYRYTLNDLAEYMAKRDKQKPL
ncbi:MerR family transcriptional regulator [Acinetobacter pollinis]|uniref:hypothetical protein n=1 Tax=Acinetobacter pollinis TaxID=2605270 RepID=UPI0018A25246|nr:hypothetical protein [Acinetobacter pollinis]MBF7690891.1 hypothetical protein [Acinetobacter pollinis]MBF7697369.1 hypothetical protein [Acinetobacter pollinis]